MAENQKWECATCHRTIYRLGLPDRWLKVDEGDQEIYFCGWHCKSLFEDYWKQEKANQAKNEVT